MTKWLPIRRSEIRWIDNGPLRPKLVSIKITTKIDDGNGVSTLPLHKLIIDFRDRNREQIKRLSSKICLEYKNGSLNLFKTTQHIKFNNISVLNWKFKFMFNPVYFNAVFSLLAAYELVLVLTIYYSIIIYIIIYNLLHILYYYLVFLILVY